MKGLLAFLFGKARYENGKYGEKRMAKIFQVL